jgi:alpha,alpha-trehalose phosphorylase
MHPERPEIRVADRGRPPMCGHAPSRNLDGMPHFDYDAVLFDLDGVLTSTTPLHAACWKQAFDEFLTEPFDIERDYLAHVDGKPRHEGVRDLLLSRGIQPAPELVNAVADRKQALVAHALESGGVDAFPGSVRWVEQLRDAGVCTAVVSASANCGAVLRAAGIDRLFDAKVDGGDVERLGLRGKPAPDGFLEAASRLGARPARSIVVEDALAGVAAGRSGDFGLVIGVARGTTPAELRRAGADIVVDDLQELVR